MPSPAGSDISIAYDDSGEGPAILFLHGIFVSKAQWEAQARAFSRDHRVIACDLRGHGESPASAEPYSVQLFAEDVARLLDGLGLDRVVCCGHSFGGMVAQELALRRPELVRGLVLAETIYGVASTPLEATLSRAASLAFGAVQPRWLMTGLAACFGAISPGGAQRIEEEAKRHLEDEANALNILRASMRFDSRWRLHEIDCPTLLVVGQIPHVPLVMAQSWEMFWRIKGARLTVVPFAGHMVHWDNPAWFNRLLGDFVDRLPQAEAPRSSP